MDKVCVIIGAPTALGQKLDGVDRTPEIIREVGLVEAIEKLGWKCRDDGDVNVDQILSDPKMLSISCNYSDSKYLSAGIFCQALHTAVYEATKNGNFVLTIGGDHSIATGTVSAVHKARKNTKIIWVDAHGDANTPETSPSGNYHGMPVAHLLGWINGLQGFGWLDACEPVKENDVVMIALRDLDLKEKELLENSNMHVFTMQDVDCYGIGQVMEMALEAVDPTNSGNFHLSLDVDAIDPTIAPGTGTKVRGGLTYREVHYICERLALTDRLKSMDLVEINPLLDKDAGVNGRETVYLGIELVQSALGKRIMMSRHQGKRYSDVSVFTDNSF